MELFHFVVNFVQGHPYWTVIWLICGIVNDSKRFHDERTLFHLIDLVGYIPAIMAVLFLILSGPIGTLGLVIKWYQNRPRPYGFA